MLDGSRKRESRRGRRTGLKVSLCKVVEVVLEALSGVGTKGGFENVETGRLLSRFRHCGWDGVSAGVAREGVGERTGSAVK